MGGAKGDTVTVLCLTTSPTLYSLLWDSPIKRGHVEKDIYFLANHVFTESVCSIIFTPLSFPNRFKLLHWGELHGKPFGWPLNQKDLNMTIGTTKCSGEKGEKPGNEFLGYRQRR